MRLLLLLDPMDGELISVQTSDVRAAVTAIADEGYDLGLSINGGYESEDIDNIMTSLEQFGTWMGEDHSRQLILVDPASVSHDVVDGRLKAV